MTARLLAVHPVIEVRDVSAAIEFYARLGFALAFRDDPVEPRYAGIRRDEVELHLQWHDAAEWARCPQRANYRFLVQDVDALHAELSGQGYPFDMKAVSDTPVAVGLGVRDGAQAAAVGEFADGVIVGSALVAALADGGVGAVRTLAADLVAGVAR